MPDLNTYLHAFNLLRSFGPKRLLRIGEYFKDFKQAFEASKEGLEQAGIEPEIANEFSNFRQSLDLEQEAEKLASDGIKVCTYKDVSYPNLLLQIPNLPPILYYRGTLNQPEEIALTVVGTRKITSYGRSVVPFLLEPIVRSGITIVSGLAYGVDAAAHRAALEYGGRTIAVLGNGIDTKSIYPKDHSLMVDDILGSGGAIISEYPPGVPALKQHFVARNRIISGLSVGTLVIECDLKSGTLLTVNHALDQNRTVYAVPGPIYNETSMGPNNFIKLGAKLVTAASDILEDLNITPSSEVTEISSDTKEEAALLELLTKSPIHTDTLIKASGLGADKVTTTLTFLEMKGKIRNIGGQQYIRSR